MRIDALHLDRFGPFTDRTLRFPEAPLTIVHGGNEAGKSTALAGLLDALFGIPKFTPYNFLHDYPKMRVGLTIRDGEGRSLAFRRRKGMGVRDTLRDLDEKSLPDDALSSFLGGFDRARFEEAFGLDQARLRVGGETLLQGGGELGASLVAAAPGLSHLLAIQNDLQDSAAELFRPRRAQEIAFYAHAERLDAARAAKARLALKRDELAAGRRRVEEAARDLEEAGAARAAAARALARLERLAAALPHLDRLIALEDERRPFADLPTLSPGFTAEAEAAGRDLAEAEREHRRLAAEIAALDTDLAGLDAPEPVLAAEPAIRAAEALRGAAEQAAERLPKRREVRAALARDLAMTARRVGADDLADLVRRRPTAHALARARRVLAARAERDAAAERRRTRLAQAEETARAIAAELAALPEMGDTGALRRTLEAALATEAALPDPALPADRAARLRTERNRLLAGLPFPVADAEAFLSLALPDAAGAAAESERRDRLEAEATRARQARDAAREARARLSAERTALGGGGPIATEAAITALREARDRRLAALLDAPAGLRAMVADALAQAIAEADALADRRALDADRIARLDRIDADAAAAAATETNADEALLAADARHVALVEGWERQWAGAGIAPPPPPESVPALHRARDALAALADRLSEAEAEAARDAARRAEAAGARAGVARALVLDTDDPATLRAALDAAEDRARARARLLDAGERQRQERAALDRDEATAAEGAAMLDAEWAAVAAEFRLSPDTHPADAAAAIEAWAEIAEPTRRLTDLQADIAGDEAAEARFRAAVEVAATEAFGAALDGPPLDAQARLTAALDAARLAADRRDGLRHRHADAGRTLALAAGAEDVARARLDAHVAAAGLDGADPLAPFLARLAARDALEAAAAEARRVLAALAPGEDAATLRTELSGRDAAALAVAVEAAGRALAAAEEDERDCVRRDTEAKAAERAMLAREGAAGAAQDERNALSDLADLAERWRLETAAHALLSAAIERWRGAHGSPVIERAGAHFRLLTDGAWDGLAVSHDGPEPVILPVRRGGATVPVSGLSEGTRDQLFLALRVAAIEDHAATATPMPLVADDLLATFDDRRASAGLRLLAGLGATTQTILFTHHDHLVAIARDVLGEGVEVLPLAG